MKIHFRSIELVLLISLSFKCFSQQSGTPPPPPFFEENKEKAYIYKETDIYTGTYIYNREPYSLNLIEKAEKGDAKAQFDLGYAYLMGQVPAEKIEQRNPSAPIIRRRHTGKAREWFKKSAEQKNHEGLIFYHKCLSTGLDGPVDLQEAAKVLEVIKEKGITKTPNPVNTPTETMCISAEEQLEKIKRDRQYDISPGHVLKDLQVEGDWIYTKDGTLIMYTGMQKEVEIPEKIGEVEIREIGIDVSTKDGVNTVGNGFSRNTNLATVKIPSSIKSIGTMAFYMCSNLENIEIPNSVTNISWCAFSQCEKIKKVNVPQSVQKIGEDAFWECKNLTEIKFADQMKEIEKGTFSSCSSLTIVKLPRTLKKIGWGAFSGCISLESISIPDGVTDIEAKAFIGCKNLTNINIPLSVTNISYSTLEETGISWEKIGYVLREEQSGGGIQVRGRIAPFIKLVPVRASQNDPENK